MSFSVTSPDLNRTIYSAADLAAAREIYSKVAEKVAPNWIKRPKGILGEMWNNPGASGLKLIHLALTINGLHGRLTRESYPIFWTKMHLLFSCKKLEQFQELVFELMIGNDVALRFSPIAYEPFERGPTKYAGRSPDFAVRLPDGDHIIEATTLYINRVVEWEGQIERFKNRFSESMAQLGLRVSCDLESGIDFKDVSISKAHLAAIGKEVSARREGNLSIGLGSEGLHISWRRQVVAIVPNFDIHNPSHFLVNGEMADVFCSHPSQLGHSISFHNKLSLGYEQSQLIYKSLVNTLRGKRDQCRTAAPHLLALLVPSSRITRESIGGLILSRIFANPQYSWISGIVICSGAKQFANDQPEIMNYLLINPLSSVRLTENFVAAMTTKPRS